MGESVSGEEAASILGVSTRRLRGMVARGDLLMSTAGGSASGRSIDQSSLERFRRFSRASGRPWSEETAWAVHDMMDGLPVDLSAQVRWRLRKALKTIDTPTFIWRMRARARVLDLQAPPGHLERICKSINPTGASRLALMHEKRGWSLYRTNPVAEGYIQIPSSG